MAYRLEAYLLQEAAPLLVELWHRKMTEVDPKGTRLQGRESIRKTGRREPPLEQAMAGRDTPRRMMTYIAGTADHGPKSVCQPDSGRNWSRDPNAVRVT